MTEYDLTKKQTPAPPSPDDVAMENAIAAGDGTLHGAIDYWQNECAKLKADLTALRDERDDFHMAYRMKCDEQTKALHVERDQLRADLAAANARADANADALSKYSRHLDLGYSIESCGKMLSESNRAKCTCGLDEAIAAARREK